MPTNIGSSEEIRLIEESRRRRARRVEIDLEFYQEYLDSYEMTADQKAEFLSALWSIIVAFTDLGYGVHPTQQVLPRSGSDRAVALLVEDFLSTAA